MSPSHFSFLPYQSRVSGDPSRVRVIEKSRRIGLTWAVAATEVIQAASSKGMDVWYLGYDEEMTREFINEAASWAKKLNVAASSVGQVMLDEDKDVLAFRINFNSGNRISALSSRPRNFRSRQGHAIIDEAAFHDDFDEALKAALAFLMWGGRVTIISTHNGVESPFATLCEDIRAGRRPYSLHKITFEDAAADGLYERISLVSGEEPTPQGKIDWIEEIRDNYGEDAPEELDCIPRRSGGAYIKRPLIEACRHDAPVVRLECEDSFAHQSDRDRKDFAKAWFKTNIKPLLKKLPRESPHWFGQDFGRVSDLSVLCPLTYAQDTRRVVPFLAELRNVPYDQQVQIVVALLRLLPELVDAQFDSTGNGGYVAERAEQLIGVAHVTKVDFTAQWYAENLPKLKAGFEDKEILVPRDADVVRDLAAFRVVNGVPTLPKVKLTEKAAKAAGKKRTRHADSAIAIALAYCASLGEGEGKAGPMDDEDVDGYEGESALGGFW